MCDGFDAATFDLDASSVTKVTCEAGAFATDLSGDPANCGYCGHNCLGATCAGGLCEVLTIYQEANEGGTPESGLAIIAITGGRIYWSYPNSTDAGVFVRSMPLDGGPSEADLLTTTTDNAQFYAAADSSGVYYTDNGELHFVASGADTDVGKNFGNVTSVALDDSNVYLTSTSVGISVSSYAKGDASVTTISGSETAPIDLVLDPPWVEWLDVPWFNTTETNSSLVRRKGGAVVAPTPLGRASSLAIDTRRNLYWYDNTTQELMQLAEDNPSAVPVAIGTYTVDPAVGISGLLSQGIVVDGARAYVAIPDAETGEDDIVEFSLCGGTPKLLTSNLRMIGTIFQDDTAIYWGEYAGALHRLAK